MPNVEKPRVDTSSEVLKRRDVLKRVRAWLELAGIQESTLSLYALGESSTIKRWRTGKTRVGESRIQRLEAFLDRHPAETWRQRRRLRRPKARAGDLSDATTST
jgi:hypothetical protein